ncbi:MAG: M48 family metallopeptidase, partial [Bacteroidia bacterium]
MKFLSLQNTFFLVVCFIFSATKAQDFDRYQPILCKGLLPKEITTLSSAKYEVEMGQETKESKRKDQEAKEKFLLYQRYFTDNLLKSGRIIVNPELTDYLNEILDILLKDEPEVRKKIRLYILRSPSVNALAMNDGTILICWGLLAQVENEAQLAYILSHEITHFKERHVLDQFQESRKRKNGRDVASEDRRKNDAQEEALVAKYSYAKHLESEADSLGLIRFLKTGYAIDAPEQSFDKLRFAYLPFANQPLDKNFFRLDGVSIPEKYFLKEVNAVKGEDEDADDLKSSHPNWGKRKKAVRVALKAKGLKDTGEAFLVSAEKFINLQNIARFELPQAYLHYQLYQEAFYNAYLLLQDNPNNYYLEAIVAKALNGMVKVKNDRTEKTEAEKVETEKVEGEIQQIYHLFEQMKNNELNMLALHYAWKLHKQYPTELEPKAVVGEIFQEMVNHHYESPKDLALDDDDKDHKEKFWAKYTLRNPLIDTAFTRYFANCLKVKKENEEWKKKNKNKNIEAFQKEQESKGARLGIDKIVVVNPRYFFESVKETQDLGLFATEKGTARLQGVIAQVAQKAKLEVELLSLAELKPSDTDKFNEVTLLSEWASEQASTKGLGIGSQQARINEIAKKHDT